MTHAFMKTDEVEEQGTEDNIESLLSKRPSEGILDQREQKRARQDLQPNGSDEQSTARAVTIPMNTTPKSTILQTNAIHSCW